MSKKHDPPPAKSNGSDSSKDARNDTLDPKKKPDTATTRTSTTLEKAAERTDEAPPSERGASTSTARTDEMDGATNTTPNDTFLGEGANDNERPAGGL